MTTNMTPMGVSNIEHLVERAYRESGPHQYLRELVVNSREAGATRIEIMPACTGGDPRASVDELRTGVQRLVVADNGRGMDPDDLLDYLNNIGGSGKIVGGEHENFGIGAKTSLLPWNHAGMVVMSWTTSNPEGAMVQLFRCPRTGMYGAKKFDTVDGFDDVVRPLPEFAVFRPVWVVHGTVVLCLGNTGVEHTYLGKDEDESGSSIETCLNKRFWVIPTLVDLCVYTEEPDRWIRRKVTGSAYHAEITLKDSSLLSKGTVVLTDRTEIDWYLRTGDTGGYIAAVYKEEIYDTNRHAGRYRLFGVSPAQVRKNLTLIARPPISDGRSGVYPDNARNSLKIRGTKQVGGQLPWEEWGQEFSDRLPEEIDDAVRKASATPSGDTLDPAMCRRLGDLFGARWNSNKFLVQPTGEHIVDPSDSTSKPTSYNAVRQSNNTTKPTATSIAIRNGIPVLAVRPVPIGMKAQSVKAKGGFPKVEWCLLEDFDDGMAAAYNNPTVTDPGGVVRIARDFKPLAEVRQYWQARYTARDEDVVSDIVNGAYGDAMVARVVHSETFVSHAEWGRTRVDKELRSEASLTMSLLGLVSEHDIIKNKLANRLGSARVV